MWHEISFITVSTKTKAKLPWSICFCLACWKTYSGCSLKLLFLGVTQSACLLFCWQDICWTPYASWLLPDELKQDKPFVTRLGPIFCNNFVVHHKPHIVAKQFGQVDVNLEGHKLSFFDHRIRFVNNRGSHGHNYTESYKIELLMWNQKLCFLEDESEIEENEGDRIPRRGNRCLIVEPLV